MIGHCWIGCLWFALIALALPCRAGLTWETRDQSVDYGLFDVKKTVEFRYTNTGKSAVTITRFQKACACLDVEYSKKPIEPGASGAIRVTYMAEESDGGGVSMGFAVVMASGKRHILNLLARVEEPLTMKRRCIEWTLNEKPLQKRLILKVNPKLKSPAFSALKNSNSLALSTAIVDHPNGKAIAVTPKWTDAKLRAFLRFSVSYKGPKGKTFKKSYKVRVGVR